MIQVTEHKQMRSSKFVEVAKIFAKLAVFVRVSSPWQKPYMKQLQ